MLKISVSPTMFDTGRPGAELLHTFAQLVALITSDSDS